MRSPEVSGPKPKNRIWRRTKAWILDFFAFSTEGKRLIVDDRVGIHLHPVKGQQTLMQREMLVRERFSLTKPIRLRISGPLLLELLQKHLHKLVPLLAQTFARFCFQHVLQLEQLFVEVSYRRSVSSLIHINFLGNLAAKVFSWKPECAILLAAVSECSRDSNSTNRIKSACNRESFRKMRRLEARNVSRFAVPISILYKE